MVAIQLLSQRHVQPIAAAFVELGWDKPTSQYERYLVEQQAGQRVVLVANVDTMFAGYVTIIWESNYPPFRKAGIPEIVDFNVLPKFRRRGIGSQLMDETERRIAERSPVAGIGVGVTPDYGAAHILYIKRGYIPDGSGIVQNGRSILYGETITIGHDQVIYFTKRLRTV